jgi:hypothetical protein
MRNAPDRVNIKARMMRNQPRKLTADRLNEAVKLARKFATGFNASDGYDLHKNLAKKLTKYKKRKLREIYNIAMNAATQPHKVVRPRNKNRLRSLNKATGLTKVPKNLKVAFVPTAYPDQEVKVEYDKNNNVKLIEVGDNISYHDVYLSADEVEEFLDDPDGLAAFVISLMPPGIRAVVPLSNGFVMGSGSYSGDTPEALAEITAGFLQNLFSRYGSGEFDPGDESSRHWVNWLGFRGFKYENQQDLLDYRRKFNQARKLKREIKKQNSKLRNQFKNRKGEATKPLTEYAAYKKMKAAEAKLEKLLKS